ncbi:MAG: hypothetical protein KA444_03815 [Bacteroidia bacterium]|nr:hypothetical protein [Bacteroidia bacterium]
MSLQPEERLMIDRYLNGALSAIELQTFMERLESDPHFRTAVSLQNLLVEGIVRCADFELQEKLLADLAYKKPRVPFGLKMIFTFLLVMALGIVLWNYIDPNSSNNKRNVFSVPWLKRPGKTDQKTTDHKTTNSKTEEHSAGVMNQNKKPEGKSELVDDGMKSAKDIVVNDSTTSTSVSSPPEDLIVKKDQLLITQNLQIHFDSTRVQNSTKENSGQSNSLSRDAADRLNPAAGLEEHAKEAKEVSSIVVEFWVSPINYRGYKMFRNKLILFGLDEPDAVRLFREDGNLYLRYFNDYFILNHTEEFTSYHPVKNKEFSSNLRK